MTEKLPTPQELPIHPWADQLENLPEGKGNFYHYGPNYTADPIVLTCDAVPLILLVKRSDNGKWALPGGFVDGDEQPAEAGLRELEEETQLILTDDQPVVLYQGPVTDPRTTRNAWPETTAMLWRVPSVQPVAASDESDEVMWCPVDELPIDLHGSHAALIETALRYIDSIEFGVGGLDQPV